jgi:hypothetical protein
MLIITLYIKMSCQSPFPTKFELIVNLKTAPRMRSS